MTDTENFEPKRTKADRQKAVQDMPSSENREVVEITIEAGTELVGTYDGMYDRTLKDENVYTGKMTDHQIGMVLTRAENPHLIFNESETETAFRYVWASNGLLKALEEHEIQDGQKIKIKRKGIQKNTSWTIITLN